MYNILLEKMMDGTYVENDSLMNLSQLVSFLSMRTFINLDGIIFRTQIRSLVTIPLKYVYNYNSLFLLIDGKVL